MAQLCHHLITDAESVLHDEAGEVVLSSKREIVPVKYVEPEHRTDLDELGAVHEEGISVGGARWNKRS